MARGRGREWWLERVVEQAASGLSVAKPELGLSGLSVG
jgi:hypothetical protein